MDRKVAQAPNLPPKQLSTHINAPRSSQQLSSDQEKIKQKASTHSKASTEKRLFHLSGQRKEINEKLSKISTQKIKNGETETTSSGDRSGLTAQVKPKIRKQRLELSTIAFKGKDESHVTSNIVTLGADNIDIVSGKSNQKQGIIIQKAQLYRPEQLRQSSFGIAETQSQKSLTSSQVKIQFDENHEEQQSKYMLDPARKQNQKIRSNIGLKCTFSAFNLQNSRKNFGASPQTASSNQSASKVRHKQIQESSLLKHKKNTQNLTIQCKSPSQLQKKITLRDYLNLNQLTTKTKNSQFLSATSKNIVIPTVPSPKQGPYSPHSGKRKAQASNIEIMTEIRRQISSDIKQIQEQLKKLVDIYETRIEDNPSKEQIMKTFAISRMLKEKVMQGNEEIIRYINQP